MKNNPSSRIYYLGMINTPGYASKVGLPLLVGAGAAKMEAVARALRQVGADAWIVSMPVLGRGAAKRYAGAATIWEDGLPVMFFATMAHPVLRKLMGMAQFMWFCATRVRRGDKVILYNHALEYFLGLLVLRLRGMVPFLDVEDVPRDDEPGWQGTLNRVVFLATLKLVARRKILVSSRIAENLKVNEFCVVYGAVDGTGFALPSALQRWEKVCAGDVLRLHYGGSLSRDTGLELFCAAVRLLARDPAMAGKSLRILVSGFGGEAELGALQKDCEGAWVEIQRMQHLDRGAYCAEFEKCHVALSLRIPGSTLAETTFPSKVVEISSKGLLLISTRVSDVSEIFDDSSAILLEQASAEELARHIRRIVENPHGMGCIAARGQERAAKVFEARAVGARLMEFLHGH